MNRVELALAVSVVAIGGAALTGFAAWKSGPVAAIAVAFAAQGAAAVFAAQLAGITIRRLAGTARRASRDRAQSVVMRRDDAEGLELAAEIETRIAGLADERDQLESALEALEEGVLTLDAEQKITLVNKAGRELLGLAERPVGGKLSELVPSAILRSLVGAASVGEAGSAELEIGGARLFALAKPLAQGSSALVVRDVTQVNRLQKIRRDFVANVSHELRTPISIILANTETLIGGVDDRAAAREFHEAIFRSATRLARLVSDLLDLSRLESGRFSLNLEEIVLEEEIGRVARELLGTASEKGVRVVLPSDGAHTVRADRHAVEQILVNLLDNAIKHTPADTEVTIRVSARAEDVLVEVEDNGRGVEPKHRARLFERFYRVDKGRSRDAGGSGLGLSIVKHLAEAMGGAVGMRPAPTTGSIFWFALKPARSPGNPGQPASKSGP